MQIYKNVRTDTHVQRYTCSCAKHIHVYTDLHTGVHTPTSTSTKTHINRERNIIDTQKIWKENAKILTVIISVWGICYFCFSYNFFLAFLHQELKFNIVVKSKHTSFIVKEM